LHLPAPSLQLVGGLALFGEIIREANEALPTWKESAASPRIADCFKSSNNHNELN
jgi:hypothetical protein